jgi:hypothetical protein
VDGSARELRGMANTAASKETLPIRQVLPAEVIIIRERHQEQIDDV